MSQALIDSIKGFVYVPHKKWTSIPHGTYIKYLDKEKRMKQALLLKIESKDNNKLLFTLKSGSNIWTIYDISQIYITDPKAKKGGNEDYNNIERKVSSSKLIIDHLANSNDISDEIYTGDGGNSGSYSDHGRIYGGHNSNSQKTDVEISFLKSQIDSSKLDIMRLETTIEKQNNMIKSLVQSIETLKTGINDNFKLHDTKISEIMKHVLA